ncbi:MAG: GntR family transcriptional regulator [Alicyclobacillus sp.]|nr:GntR family transcriptional regulator [Alicyclobacillus sp.]
MIYQNSDLYNRSIIHDRRRPTVARGGVVLQPIQRAQPLVTQVYQYLRDSILTGQIAAGEKIVETRLAADLQVSRSPVREAIRLLLKDQLLTEQDGAICVFQPSLEDYFELYDLRLALEPAAARKAAGAVASGHAHGEHLLQLQENLAATKRCVDQMDMAHLLSLNAAFHHVVWEMAENTRFIRILVEVSALIQYYGRLVLRVNNLQTNIVAEHGAIVEALQAGDGEAAANAMHRHITRDLEVFKAKVASAADDSASWFGQPQPAGMISSFKRGAIR